MSDNRVNLLFEKNKLKSEGFIPLGGVLPYQVILYLLLGSSLIIINQFEFFFKWRTIFNLYLPIYLHQFTSLKPNTRRYVQILTDSVISSRVWFTNISNFESIKMLQTLFAVMHKHVALIVLLILATSVIFY